jgi:hypothetical protein
MRNLVRPSSTPRNTQRGTASFNETIDANKVIVDGYNTTQKKPKLKFPGYNSTALKAAIKNVASGCCGYCGKRPEGLVTVVVEHYRPKKELKFQQSPLSPYKCSKSYSTHVDCLFGYYQYGDDAFNMLPSCPACNSGQGIGENSGTYISKKEGNGHRLGYLDKTIKFGKDNFFPLYKVKRVNSGLIDHRYSKRSIDDITSEIPLLFNPYIDVPEELFEYKEVKVSGCTNQAYIQIKPNKTASKFKRLKAEASISLLGLNRKELCHDRATKDDKLNSLYLEIVASIKDNNWDLVTWVKYSRSYANAFDPINSDLLGLGKIKYGMLAEEIRELVRTKVTCTEKSLFTNNDEFQIVVSELNEFSKLVNRNQTSLLRDMNSVKVTSLLDIALKAREESE